MMMHYIVVVYETPVLYAMVAMMVVAAAKHCLIPSNRLYDAYVFRSNPFKMLGFVFSLFPFIWFIWTLHWRCVSWDGCSVFDVNVTATHGSGRFSTSKAEAAAAHWFIDSINSQNNFRFQPTIRCRRTQCVVLKRCVRVYVRRSITSVWCWLTFVRTKWFY